jgi:hypothetical protein
MNNKFVPLAIQRLHYIIFPSNADSKDTIHTAVSQKSDITHSGDMSLVNAQQSDRNIQKMRQWVEKGLEPPILPFA